MRKLSNCASFSIIGTCAFLLTYMLVLLYWPYQTIEYRVPFRVLTKQVKAGDMLIYEQHYIRHTKAETHVTRTLVNDIFYVLSDTRINAPMGEHTAMNELLIPEAIPPGKYHLECKLEWQVNHLRTIRKIIKSEPFEVVR